MFHASPKAPTFGALTPARPRPVSRPFPGLTFWPRPVSRPLRGLTFSMPHATMDRMSECREAHGCARTAIPTSCRQKNRAAVVVLTAAPLSGNLRELVRRPCAGAGLSPSVDRHAVALQSQRLLRSFCLSVSGHVAPSAAPAGVGLEPSPAAETG